MKISYNWLKQFIKTDWSAAKTATLLTGLGLEVEGIEKFESVKGGLEGIVAGHVLSCEKHPNADRLKLVEVDLGAGNIVPIVCGAPNIAEGQKVPVATVGAVLYDEENQPWTIKRSKIRGEESQGMVCSEKELKLGENSEGIMVLEDTVEPGTPCAGIFNIENDYIFEIGLTPNRADAMSHFGVARDLRAGLLQQGITTTLITPSVSSFRVDNTTLKIDVAVEDPDRCPRYCGLTLSGIKVSESPQWLKNRLVSIGLTPRNNVVDATNYVLHELGQPLHAFDASAISGKKIIVKTVKEGTEFVALDGAVHQLHEEDLMICDTRKPLCIGGVFGGLNSGITEKTTTVFLESACFDPVSIRKTAKRHGLHTDASFRFERGVDVPRAKYVLRRAALLIKELAGGEITSDIIDIYTRKTEDFQVFLSFEKIHRLAGQKIPEEKIKQILTSLEIRVDTITETGLALTIPSYRVDVRREADVIEEILRVYGYNKINFTGKLNISVPHNLNSGVYKIQDRIAQQLVSQGFYEIMTNSLVSSEYLKLSSRYTEEAAVKMLNPLSGDMAQMRQTLLFSGLETVAYNLNRKQNDIRLFEFGKSYHQFKDVYAEHKHLALFISGNQTPENWEQPVRKSNFFYAKGIVINLLHRLGITQLSTACTDHDLFPEGISLSHKKLKLVELGVVKQPVLNHFGIKQEVLFADVNWDRVVKLFHPQPLIGESIPRFPEVRRDFSLLLDTDITFEAVYDIAKKIDDRRIKDINLFDVYEGKNLPGGKKSYAVSFVLQDEEKTLTDKEIDTLMSKLQKSFEKQLGAELRS